MIVLAVLEVVLLVLEALNALLPDVPVTFSSQFASYGAWVGSQLGGLDGFLPISELAPLVGWALGVYLPFYIAFVVFRWLWQHVPQIGGSGA